MRRNMLLIEQAERDHLKARSRADEFDIRFRLRDARARDHHRRRVGERLIDEHIELWIVEARPPARGRPALAREMDVVGERDLLRRDLGIRRAVMMDQRATRQHARDPRAE